jgi:hypothetical protein
MNGPLDCPFCKGRPTRWFAEEGQPYVVCDNHSEPIKVRLSDWNVRSSVAQNDSKVFMCVHKLDAEELCNICEAADMKHIPHERIPE